MRVLVLSTWWPEPADNGARMRAIQMLRQLAAGHEVHLIAFAQGPIAEARAEELRQLCASVQAIPRPGRAITLADNLRSLAVPEPASVRVTWSHAFATAVDAAGAQLRPDVAVALEIDVAPYARRLRGTPLVLEELELANILEHHRQQRSPHARLRYLLTALQHRRYVASFLQEFAAVTVVSEAEARLVRQVVRGHSVNVSVIPNGADVGGCSDYSYEPDNDTLIYPGALTYSANLDAVRYFLTEIFPLIRAARPQTILRVTGRSTAEQRAALPQTEGLELTGYVDDVRALIARTAVEVVPLREGGGTRLKLLEALALGTPVVSTAKGAEGLDLEPGRHLLVADTPRAFADATLELLVHPDQRRRLSEAGRRAVAEQYDWRSITRRLDDLLSSVVEQRKRHRAIA